MLYRGADSHSIANCASLLSVPNYAKRYVFGVMPPLNLRFAGGLLREEEGCDVDGVGCRVPPLGMRGGGVDRALRGPLL